MFRFSGEKLKELRGKRTQMDLASAMRGRGFGTTQTQVSRWEAGQAPRRYIVAALAEELGCALEDLYDEDDSEMPLSREEASRLLARLGRTLGVRS